MKLEIISEIKYLQDRLARIVLYHQRLQQEIDIFPAVNKKIHPRLRSTAGAGCEAQKRKVLGQRTEIMGKDREARL